MNIEDLCPIGWNGTKIAMVEYSNLIFSQQIDDDVILFKPVSVVTFHKLLEGAEKISEDMEQIHQLGYVPEEVR